MSKRGRPPLCDPEVLAFVIRKRHAGTGPTAIANQLNIDQIPTPAGRPKWDASYVDRLLRTKHAQQAMQEICDCDVVVDAVE
jgi:hypothetical protein